MGGPGEGASGVRSRYGVIALTPGHVKVALVRVPGAASWQFPSVLPARETDRLDDQLEVALGVAEEQLGLDVTQLLCLQPVIHALGPEPRVSTKFFMAFNVPEDKLVTVAAPVGAAAAAGAGGEAQEEGKAEVAWKELKGLAEETADQSLAGNQLVAVLRQLQGMIKRRYEMVMPADDGHQEVAALMSWHEAVQGGDMVPGGVERWVGIAPKDFLEQHCRANKLPAPAFNVFEHGRTPTGRTHFCATCILPHTGLQITPDAVYPSPLDALENAAVLAVLYLEGALAPSCPLVHFAAAGEMAQVPHAFVTEQEVRQDARSHHGERERHKRVLERQVQEEQAVLQHRMEELRRQQHMLASGEALALPGGGPGGGNGGLGPGGDRGVKRARLEKAPLSLLEALQQIPRDRHPLMALKELCDKCRWPQPLYEEIPRGSATIVALTLQQAGVSRTLGPAHEDRKQAKMLVAQIVMDGLRSKHQGRA